MLAILGSETAGLCCAGSPRVKLPRAARRQQRCEFTKAGVKAPPSPGAGNSLSLPHASEKQQASLGQQWGDWLSSRIHRWSCLSARSGHEGAGGAQAASSRQPPCHKKVTSVGLCRPGQGGRGSVCGGERQFVGEAMWVRKHRVGALPVPGTLLPGHMDTVWGLHTCYWGWRHPSLGHKA